VTTQLVRQRRSRWILVLIALVSILPFVFAWLYANNPHLITKRSNFGNLIHPAQPLDYAQLISGSSSSDTTLQEIKGRWVLLQILPGGTCGAPCRKSLHATRQVRLMLNKDLPRLRRLFLRGNGDGGIEQEADLLQGGIGEAGLEKLTRAMGRAPEEGTVILLDPFANAMMWYGPGFDPYGMLKDLKQLLRTSQIG